MDTREFIILICVSVLMYIAISSLPGFYWEKAVNFLRYTALLDRREMEDRRSYGDRRSYARESFERRIHHRRVYD
jgi:hypothetical protein